MAKKLLLPKDAREHLLRRYNNQHKAWLLGDGQWPLSIALGIPTEKDVASDVLSVREWVDAWCSLAITGPGFLDFPTVGAPWNATASWCI